MNNSTNFFELESEKYWSFPASQREESREEIRQMILSGDYLGSRKIDGNYFRFVKDMNGGMSLQSRSRGVKGTFTNKLESVPHLRHFFDALPCGTCLLGELYLPENETAAAVTKLIGGKLERAVEMQQDERNRLHYYVFDVWQWDGVSQLETTAANRFALLDTIRQYETPYVSFARYFTGEELLNELNAILSAGGEGMVLTRKDSTPAPGKRTARKTLKVKREMANTLDVVIMGANPPTKEYAGKLPEAWPYWENGTPVTRNYALGLPGSLQIGVMRDGELVQVGSLGGLSDDILGSWNEYVGHVCEITCMEIHETGGLRHPRFLRWRNDLTEQDCEYSKIYPDETNKNSEGMKPERKETTMKKHTGNFTNEASKVLKTSDRIVCRIAENDAIYVTNGFVVYKMDSKEYAAIVQPVTCCEAGNWAIDKDGKREETKTDLAKFFHDAVHAVSESDTLQRAPLTLDAGKFSLACYYHAAGDFAAFYNAKFIASLHADAVLLSPSAIAPAIAYIGNEPFALVLPVKPKDEATRTVKAYFTESGNDTTSSPVEEELQTKLTATQNELSKANTLIAQLQELAQQAAELAAMREAAVQNELSEANALIDQLREQVAQQAAELAAMREAQQTAAAQTTAPAAQSTQVEPSKEVRTEPKTAAEQIAARFADMAGVTVIIKGAQTNSPVVWLSGDTDKHADAIKAAGAQWSNKRSAFYVRVA